MKENHTRSMLKSITFRIIATLTTMILVYLATGSLEITLGIGFLDIVSKLFIYYFHERVWDSIKWGTIPYKQDSTLLANGGEKEK